MAGRIMTIHAVSAIHNGSGQGSGVIDQPVIRERITGWPCINGESIKGVLRDACDNDGNGKSLTYAIHRDGPFFHVFGPPTTNASDYGGAVVFPSALLLCFPLRSYFGTFAWITCPLALKRWKNDHLALGTSFTIPGNRPPTNEHVLVHPESVLKRPAPHNKVYLEHYKFEAVDTPELNDLAATISTCVFPESSDKRADFLKQFAIVSDDLFTHFVKRFTTRSARIRLEQEHKIVAEGALWYEEDVPAESIFWTPLWIRKDESRSQEFWSVLENGTRHALQIGGNKSVGRGLATMRMTAQGGPQ